MKHKILIFSTTGLFLGVGVLIGSEFGLIGLVIINILIGLSLDAKPKSNSKQNNQQKQNNQPRIDYVELVASTINAVYEIIDVSKKLPAFIVHDKQKMIEIGFVLKTRQFIPMFKMVKGNIVPLMTMIDEDIPDKLMKRIDIQDYPPSPQFNDNGRPMMPPPYNQPSYPQGDNYNYEYQSQNQPQRQRVQSWR